MIDDRYLIGEKKRIFFGSYYKVLVIDWLGQLVENQYFMCSYSLKFFSEKKRFSLKNNWEESVFFVIILVFVNSQVFKSFRIRVEDSGFSNDVLFMYVYLIYVLIYIQVS